MKRILKITLLTIFFFLCVIGLGGSVYWYDWYTNYQEVRQENAAELAAQDAAISAVLASREAAQTNAQADPFGEDDVVRVLVIGLDSRAGQSFGHCDAIQMIEIDRRQAQVTITAVPRGTYSPLPPGTAATSSDYYVSNSCALGGLAYGIGNIERILHQTADYIVLVGFSETLGILRTVELPTTETLQWLRHRQGYAIGEPQRARNHSTFLKQMLVRFLPDDVSLVDKTFHYIIYNMIRTDLSFGEAETIIRALTEMNIKAQPERVQLAMRPAYDVQDIPYDPEHIDDHLAATVGRISGWLSPKDYSGQSEADIQAQLLKTIAENEGDAAFAAWAFENDLWLQIADDTLREQTRWDMMRAYFAHIPAEEQQAILADFILEMQHLEQPRWEAAARELLLSIIEGEQSEI